MNPSCDRGPMTATVAFRPATNPERRACRMLLPESSGWAWPAEYLVALSDSPRQLLGTLAYVPTLHPDGPAWFIASRVVRAFRRQGIGRRLLDLLIDRARPGGITSLVSQVDSGSGPEAADFLLGMGFRASRTMTTFEGDIDLDHFESVFRPICDRLEARGKVPRELRIVPMAQSPLDLVGQLYASNLGGTVDGVESFIRGALARGGLGASFTLILGGKVVGLQLMDARGPVVEVHAKIVAPEYRRGWANAIMTREAVSRLRLLGRHRLRFTAADHVRYTLNFAARHSAEVVAVATQYIRKIEPAAG